MDIINSVARSIEEAERNQIESALLHACIAIDASAQKHYKKPQSSAATYISFLRHYYWILEPMTGAGINFDETIWENLDPKGARMSKVKLDLASIIYYFIRCPQAHGDTVDKQISFSSKQVDGSVTYGIQKGKLTLPDSLIFGLLGIAVFCKVNKDLVCDYEHWLAYQNNRFGIKDWWGLEDSFKPIALKYNKNRITLDNLGGLIVPEYDE